MFVVSCPLLLQWGSIWIPYQLYISYHGLWALQRKMSIQVKKYYYCYFITFKFSLKLCMGLLGHLTSVTLISTLFISISAWVSPQESPALAQRFFGSADAVSKWGSGICHFSSTCRFTFEGLKTIQSKLGGKELFFPPTSESNYLIKIHHSFCPRSSVT